MIIYKFIIQYNSGHYEEFYVKAKVAQLILDSTRNGDGFIEFEVLHGREEGDNFLPYDETFLLILNLNCIERLQFSKLQQREIK